ncbi:MAG: HigA family addiction module antidote protein [Hyphomonadaceae bacterium]|nr:HigA family addiction module antidote protein [Hyphomonadaceae bacterium]
MTTSYPPIHPVEILKEEFLGPLGVSAAELARALRVPSNRIIRLLNGQAAVTPDTALRLARALRTTLEFWLNLQSRFDPDTATDATGRFDDITPIFAA